MYDLLTLCKLPINEMYHLLTLCKLQINEMYHLLTWQDEDDDVSAEAEHLREEDWIPEQAH